MAGIGGELIFFLSLTDYLQISLAVLFLLLLLLESFADDHHFRFQTLKHSLTPEERNFHRNKEIRDGFYQSGTFFLGIFLFLIIIVFFQGFSKYLDIRIISRSKPCGWSSISSAVWVVRIAGSTGRLLDAFNLFCSFKVA
jgi:hypothetical protein